MLIWSPLEKTDQYAAFCGGTVTSKITAFIALVKAGTKAIVFVLIGNDAAIKKQFDLFCQIQRKQSNGMFLLLCGIGVFLLVQ